MNKSRLVLSFVLGASMFMNINAQTISITGGGTVVVNGRVVSGTSGVVGAGTVRTENRSVGVFSKLKVEGPAEVSYVVGKETSVRVSAQPNVLPLVVTEARDDQLYVGFKDNFTSSQPVKLVVTGPSLSAITVSGSGQIRAGGLTGKNLSVSSAGSGDLILVGAVDGAAISVTGSGAIDAAELRVKELTVLLAGSGDVIALAIKSANVTSAGSGSVKINGRPTDRAVSRSGSGTIKFL